ncbi:MAG: hypothetical protein NZ700_17235 [Gemmataceae bacterium]|nr:hypothetical protein [Gemmataceae bacterium]MDW8264848.1 hypothetical protein [Gemmataceae bacterium]
MIAFDWTEIHPFHTLVAAVVKGRAVPLLWASYPDWVLSKSQNTLEEGLFYLLKDMLSADLEVILLADRGFGRTELARTCQRLTIEEVFGHHENKRNRRALRHPTMTQANRLDRLWLILVLTSILPVALGLDARSRFRLSPWCSSNDSRQCSVLTIGRWRLDRMELSIGPIIAAVLAAFHEASPNWR